MIYTSHNGTLQTLVTVITEAGPDRSFTEVIHEINAGIQCLNAHQTVESVDTLTQEYFIKGILTCIPSLIIVELTIYPYVRNMHGQQPSKETERNKEAERNREKAEFERKQAKRKREQALRERERAQLERDQAQRERQRAERDK